MHRATNRREFLRQAGLSAAALPFICNLPSLGFANPRPAASSGWSSCSAPTASSPRTSGRTRKDGSSPLKESSRRWSPTRIARSSLHGVCDKVRGDGDNHMRGIGCLLTGIELFPGNIQGGSRHPRRLGQRHLHRSGNQERFLQSQPETRTRFGSLEFGVMVPDRADTWTRMVYAGPNKPIAPIDDPYQMFNKLYGQLKDRETLCERPGRDCRRTCRSMGDAGQPGRSPTARRACHVRPRRWKTSCSRRVRRMPDMRCPELEPGVKEENDNMPKISKMQIELMVNSFRPTSPASPRCSSPTRSAERE